MRRRCLVPDKTNEQTLHSLHSSIERPARQVVQGSVAAILADQIVAQARVCSTTVQTWLRLIGRSLGRRVGRELLCPAATQGSRTLGIPCMIVAADRKY